MLARLVALEDLKQFFRAHLVIVARGVAVGHPSINLMPCKGVAHRVRILLNLLVRQRGEGGQIKSLVREDPPPGGSDEGGADLPFQGGLLEAEG